MKSKIKLLEIIAFIAVMGLVITTCDNGTTHNYFKGTWYMDNGSVLYFYSSSWEWINHSMSDVNDVLRQYDFKGTYTFNGNTATLISTHYRYTEGGYWESWTGKWTVTRNGDRVNWVYNGSPNSKMVQNQSIENRGYGKMK